jgi:alpha-mannosidase
MNLYLSKIQKCCEILLAASRRTVAELPLRALEMADYKVGHKAPEGEYLPFSHVEGLDKRYWIKTEVKTPIAGENESLYFEMVTGASGWDATNPQIIVYINGQMTCGLDVNHTLAPLEENTENAIDCYLYSGTQFAHFPVNARVVAIRRRVEKLYFDMLVPYEACRDVYTESSAEFAAAMRVLDRAHAALDLRDFDSPAFFESVERAIALLEEEFYGALCSAEGKPVVHCVGHTHIDVEWRWDRRQTREKIQRSAATAISLMKEYPDYKFMLSQPELYRYLSEEAPEKMAEVKALSEAGRWEIEGALYLECDCNLTSGESLVRQLLYGKKYMREEFGKESRVCFLPDVFGYSAAMPQILKKSGVDHFITSKISWNDTNTLPVDAFLWQGIDGSEILSSFITTWSFVKNGPQNRQTTYVGKNIPTYIRGAWERFAQKEYANVALNTYGHGDGGGGPTREMLEYADRLAKGFPGMPVLRLSLLSDYSEALSSQFAENVQKLGRAPRWVGELYLEYHRGTYTSQAATKRGNRKSELSLGAAEALSATDLYFGGAYDKAGMDLAWRDTLHNQFHDILPGSSVHSVYEYTKEDYARILGYTDSVKNEKLSAIASRIETDGGVLVYNPLGFARRGEITVDGESYTTEKEIPAFGYAVIRPEKKSARVRVGERNAENDFYRIEIDGAGRIISLYDKRAARELVPAGTCMNEFRSHEDYPLLYDAWELTPYATEKPYVLDAEAKITSVYDGTRAGFEILHTYGGSTVKQTLWLYSDSPRIDLAHEIDWHEKHQILKLFFPCDLHANEATYEIQFGHVTRPTHKNTSWEEAKFEVCGQKWVDISEYGYGFALLNDCKYGYSAEGSTLALTVLKCPDEPDSTADEGYHTFTCSMYPHVGDFRAAGVIREAYALNQPLIFCPVAKNSGNLSESFSMVECDNPAVIIDGIKRAEKGDGLILRLYESFGGKAKAKIRVAEGYTKAFLVNLMEENPLPLPIEDGCVSLDFGAFEIHTLLLEK